MDEVNSSNKELRKKLVASEEEIASLKDSLMALKHHNTILKHTIEQLKSPALIAKYEQNGALKERLAQRKTLAKDSSG